MNRENLCAWMLSMSFFLLASCAAIGWSNNGFSNSDEAQWEAAGFSPDEPEIAAGWREQNISPRASMMWREASFLPAEAKSWEGNFFTIQEAENWIRIGGFSKSSGNDAASWRNAGFTPEKAAPYALKGIPLADAIASRQQKADALSRDREWSACGFSRDERLKWKRNGYDSRDACSWKKKDFSLGSAKEWKSVNFDVEEASLWRTAGFTPSAASDWKSIGFMPADAARSRRVGLTPLLASVMRMAGTRSSSVPLIIRRAKNYCGQMPDNDYPFMTSPYSLEGHCYVMEAASIYQLIGKSRGIMSAGYGEGELFYIDTSGEILDPNAFPAIVKVTGVYKYETVAGSVNIIPLVKKITSLRR